MLRHLWFRLFEYVLEPFFKHLATFTAIGEVIGVGILLYYGFGVLGKRPIQKRDVLIFRLTLVALVICTLLFQTANSHMW